MILSDKYHENLEGEMGISFAGKYILYTATAPTVYLKGPRAGRPAGRLRAAAGQAPGAGRQAQGQLRTDQSGAGQGYMFKCFTRLYNAPNPKSKIFTTTYFPFLPANVI